MFGLFVRSHMNAGQDGFRDKCSKQNVDFESLISKRLRLTMSAEGGAKFSVKKVSGARPDRRELLKLLKALTPGDVVTVTRIDQLARSTL